MKIVAFGCSVTFGTALSNPDTESWPAVLGESLNCEVVNRGIPGASNLEILHSILNYKFDPDDTAVVMWARPNRDYIFGHGQVGIWQDTDLVKNWMNVHSEDDLITRTWLYIHYANLYLASRKIICHNFSVTYLKLNLNKPKFVDVHLHNSWTGVHLFFDKASDGKHPGPNAHKKIAGRIKSVIGLLTKRKLKDPYIYK